MVMGYWSVETKFWQVSIDHNMDVQYQRTKTKWCMSAPLLAGVWPPSCATFVVVVAVVHICP